jgi:hypothetical protein
MQKTRILNMTRVSLVKSGSPSRTRTYDLLINSQPLYQLSYRGPLAQQANYSRTVTILQVVEPRGDMSYATFGRPLQIVRLNADLRSAATGRATRCRPSVGRYIRFRVM